MNKTNRKTIYLNLVLILSLISAIGFSQSLTRANNFASDSEDRVILIKIPFRDINERDSICGLGIDITGANNGVLSAIVTTRELMKITALGYQPVLLIDDYHKLNPNYESKSVPKPYHGYADIKAYFQTAATDNPSFIKYYTIGASVQNRELFAVKITDNPEVEESEPEVRLLSLHHGNELSSSEFSLYFLKYLIAKYKSNDPAVVELINTTEIWIDPMVNPDGMEKSSGPTRYNSHGYDVNRNYESPDGDHDDIGGPYPFSEPEIQAIRSFSLPTGNTINNNFNLSLTYHSGEVCFNYVWNYTPVLAPDDAYLQVQGETYKDMVHAAGLTDFWVTNGYAWYKTLGDCNDWSYGFTSSLDTTIEMTSAYAPSATTQSQIDAYCLQQLEGTLYSIWLAGEGIRGRVVDDATSAPLLATISVHEVRKDVSNDPSVYGDFYRLLLPGKYTVDIKAENYITQTFSNVVVPASGATQKKRNYTDLGVIRLKKPVSGSNYWMTK